MADVLKILQKHHIFVLTIASTNLLGPASSEPFYNFVSKLNGVFAFTDDAKQGYVSMPLKSVSHAFDSDFCQRSWSYGRFWANILQYFSG